MKKLHKQVRKRIKKASKKRRSLGSSALYIQLIAVAVAGAFLLIRNVGIKGPPPPKSPPPVNILLPTSDPAKSNLQLYTFGYITIPPSQVPISARPTPGFEERISKSSGRLCARDSKKENCDCPPDEEIWPYCNEPLEGCNERGGLKGNPPNVSKQFCFYDPTNPKTKTLAERKMKDPNCQLYCIGKPVIYLYPTEPTIVDVIVTSPGRFYISDPIYPEGGWQNVLAHPDGSLVYEGGNYHELYYETEVDHVRQPKTGLVIPTAHLEDRLEHIIDQLGLKENERREFLDYWLPQLYELKSPYILFSLVDQDEKERIDHVAISPKPDTFINFLAYFKPVNTPLYPIEPLILPKEAPQRIGFTAVEWGGTIEK